jgi:hypothetical protein
MLHKRHKDASPIQLQPETTETPASTPKTGLHILPRGTRPPQRFGPHLLDLLMIASRRCSAFFAEAAVLVLVFGVLDYFMLKGRIEFAWIIGALGISVGLLAASILMDFTAHRWVNRWVKAHP